MSRSSAISILFLGLCLTSPPIRAQTVHNMTIEPDKPGDCSVTSLYDGEVHRITITFTGQGVDASSTDPLSCGLDGALWAIAPAQGGQNNPSTSTVIVQATTFAKTDFSAKFKVTQKKPGAGGGGGQGGISGDGYANQIQIHAYAPGAGTAAASLMPRAAASNADHAYYGIVTPHDSNTPTSLKLAYHTKDATGSIGNGTITLTLPTGLDVTGTTTTTWSTSSFPNPLVITAKLKSEVTTPQAIKLKLESSTGGTAEDSVTLLPVDLDVNGDGDISDPCDGLATYMPGYELSTAKLHTGTSFENSQYAGPQSMNIIIDNLPSSMADEAHIRIVAASNGLGYCGNGSIPGESQFSHYWDFTLTGKQTTSPIQEQEATVSIAGSKMVIPIYCHDYGGWCEVEITLKKNGATIGSPIKLTLPQDVNGDRLADHWQIQQINDWNAQYSTSLDNTISQLQNTWPQLSGDKEEKDPDKSGPLFSH